ncbi:hypothetical protein HDE_12038 [Halotydeus destructor]|nr:hypothetical protein HDE_12038 [Halotydeus destructor]
MTTRQFFVTFPNLYQYLLDEIHACLVVDGIQNPNNSSPLYQVILILVRLMPSSLENDVVDISAFLPLLLEISIKCPHFRVRHLASKSFAQLAGNHDKTSFLASVSLTGSSTKTNNEVQGTLLLIDNIILHSSEDLVDQLASKFSELILAFVKLFASVAVNSTFPFVSLGLVLSCIDGLLPKNNITTSGKIFDYVSQICDNLLNVAQEKDVSSLGIDAEEAFIRTIQLTICHSETKKQVSVYKSVLQDLHGSQTNVKIAVLQLLKKALKSKFTSLDSDDIEDSLCYDYPFNNLKHIAITDVDRLVNTGSFFVDLILHGKRHEKDLQAVSTMAYLAAYYAGQLDVVYDFVHVASEMTTHMIKADEVMDEETKASATLAMTPVIRRVLEDSETTAGMAANCNVLRTWCDLVYENFSAELDYVSRKAVACFIQSNIKLLLEVNLKLHETGKPTFIKSVVHIAELLIRLTHDDEVEVRRVASDAVHALTGSSGPPLASQASLQLLVKFLVKFGYDTNSSCLILESFTRMIFENNEFVTDDDEDRLFDKSKLNVYEDVVLRNEVLLEAVRQSRSVLLDEEAVNTLSLVVFSSEITQKDEFVMKLINWALDWLNNLKENATLQNICTNSNYFYAELNLSCRLDYVRIICEEEPGYRLVCEKAKSLLSSDIILSSYCCKVLSKF